MVVWGSYLDDQIERLVDNPHIVNAKKGSKMTPICGINGRNLSRQQFGHKTQMSKLWYDNVTAATYFNNMRDIKSQTCNNILYAKYGIFMPKTNIGLQQHIYLEQSMLMQISNLEHQRMPTEGKLNPALFHKFVEKFVKPDIYISLVLELISNWIDLSYVSWRASGNQSRGSSYQCLLCYLEQQ